MRFDDELRRLTEETIRATRAMFHSGRTPLADYQAKRCDRCSLLDLCQPRLLARAGGVEAWIDRQLQHED